MTKVLYIAGYGRSGSTVLALLLSQAEGVISLGEVGSLHAALQSSRQCSCGELLTRCPFWRDIESTKDRNRRDADASSHDDSISVIALEYAFNKTGASILIDSTKTAWYNAARPWRLSRAGYEIYIVHLVRNFSDVLSSARAGRNSALERGEVSKPSWWETPKTILAWTFANLAAWAYRFLGQTRYLRLRYELLVSCPEAAVEELQVLLGHDLREVIPAAQGQIPMFPSHEINGNRLLRSGPVYMRTHGAS